ncbi:hypothetical protein D3C78_1880300 [compost metagenome]
MLPAGRLVQERRAGGAHRQCYEEDEDLKHEGRCGREQEWHEQGLRSDADSHHQDDDQKGD